MPELIKKQAEGNAQTTNNFEATESNRISQINNDGTQKSSENKQIVSADLNHNSNMRNNSQLAPKIPAVYNQYQDPPMDVSKLNLDFLGLLSKGFSNFNPAANRDSKVNVSVLIGNRNVSVENKNVLQ